MNTKITVPPVVPGQAWTDLDGKRRYICYACGTVCTTPDDFDEEESLKQAREVQGCEPKNPVNICDCCYPGIIANLKAKGLIV